MGTSSGVVLLCSFWCHSSIQVPFTSEMWLRCMMCRISSLGAVGGGGGACALGVRWGALGERSPPHFRPFAMVGALARRRCAWRT